MKRIVVFVLIIYSVFSLSAEATLEIAPYTGGYGIPIASPNYLGGIWKKPTDKDFNDTKNYTDNEMIALGGLQNLSRDEFNAHGGNLKVTITCDNGFYLVSQSHPAFKRPFEFQLVWKYQLKYQNSWGDSWGGETVVNSDDRISANTDSSSTQSIGNSWQWGDAPTIYFWFDLVLILPGEIKSDSDTLVVTENGRQVEYPLIEADDYAAVVTITIEYGDLVPATITIPFTGYYKRGEYKKSDDVCSLLVTPTSEAAHLSIPEDRGTWQTVGTLDFMLSTYRSDASSSPYVDNPVIFASSSRDADDTTADVFRLVHESVGFNTPLTQTNSIQYTVRLRKTQGLGTESYEFDGTGNIEDVRQSPPDPNGGESYGIVPVREQRQLNNAPEMDYYAYTGEVEVMLEPGSNVMYEGRYTGTIYIHVVADVTPAWGY